MNEPLISPISRASRPIPKAHAIYTIAVIGFIYTLHLVIPMYSTRASCRYSRTRGRWDSYTWPERHSAYWLPCCPSVIRKFGNYTQRCGCPHPDRPLLWSIGFYVAIGYKHILRSANSGHITHRPMPGHIPGSLHYQVRRRLCARPIYATLNASWVIAPLIGSMLISGTNDYHNTYVAGLAMLIPLFYLIYRNFPRFKDPNYTHLSPWQLTKHISHNRNWVKLFSANLILQFL